MLLNRKLTIAIVLGLFSLQTFAQDKPEVTVGGALRFNYNLSSWKDGHGDRGGDFGYDVFRVNSTVSYKDVKLNAEYRHYSTGFGGGMLKQGWVGYDFNDANNLQLGLTQVPFGITQYNSSNWFFSMAYYVGLEDDHDMGVKYTHTGERLEYALAFFKNAEDMTFGGDISDSRYSYDVSSIDVDGDGTPDLRNKETNQVNGKIAYKLGGESVQHKIGVSGQFGGLYNMDTQTTGNHYAWAGHYELSAGNLSAKAQVAGYNHNNENADAEPAEADGVVGMTAYGYPYLTAAEAMVYTVGLSYSVPVDWHPVSNLTFYNDFGMLSKAEESFEDSYMNVAGVMVTAGSVYTYIDFAAGKDHPWLGPNWTNGLGAGSPDASWEMRFNVNLGYYF